MCMFMLLSVSPSLHLLILHKSILISFTLLEKTFQQDKFLTQGLILIECEPKWDSLFLNTSIF